MMILNSNLGPLVSEATAQLNVTQILILPQRRASKTLNRGVMPRIIFLVHRLRCAFKGSPVLLVPWTATNIDRELWYANEV